MKKLLTGRGLLLAGLIWAIGLMLVTPVATFAGQGGTSKTDDNSTVFIIIGLVAVLVVAGVGLVLSRRKR